jgi:pyruvate formate lyase activating enzyme
MDAKDKLDQFSSAASLFERINDADVRCLACAHRCLIHAGKRGICKVRFNADGTLMVPHGYVAGAQMDPVEKKPFTHFLPGSQVLTFGMLGCNFHCAFCQNWHSSQALRDPCAGSALEDITPVSAEKLVDYAVANHAASIASSYNEPLITAEWAVEAFKLAREKGLKTAMVSNGYATPECLDFIHPWLDALKIDLKSMQNAQYRKMGGTLQPVLDTIKRAYELGLWVEVVTLVIPGFNDSIEELWETSRYLSSLSADIPWHVTGYHPDYQMLDAPPTSAETLQRAAEIGQEAGLRYVYAGNLPGRVGSLEDTHCPKCTKLLIQRRGYHVLKILVTPEGTCPFCGEKIAGVFA